MGGSSVYIWIFIGIYDFKFIIYLYILAAISINRQKLGVLMGINSDDDGDNDIMRYG